jgi:transposase
MFLLPESVDDYVGVDNPPRFMDAIVDELDLAAAGFCGVEPKATGRPGYAPADLLKLYIYGYLNRVRSSRRLEMECHRNTKVIWLLRSLKPVFNTIADFRRDNRAAFRSVFRQLLCRRLDLFGRELLAVDGTRIKAVNNKDRNFTRNSLQNFIRAADERWMIIFGGSTKAMSRKAERAAARAHEKSRREDRGAAREARPLRGDAGGSRTNRREPDFADRSRQPGDGRPYACCGWLQCAGRRRRRAQDDHRAGYAWVC